MSAASYHRQFESLLPRFRESARIAFRNRPPVDREEAVADVVAAAWSAWHGLIARGKDPLQVGPHGILSNAIRYVKSGRRVGHTGTGRGGMDPWSFRARRRAGFRLMGLAAARRQGELRAWVAGDHRSTPAEHASFLVDFNDWLGRLPPRRRRTAELLAQGYGTGEVAREVGVTAPAIAQARAALARSWREFQGERRSEGDRRPVDRVRVDPVAPTSAIE